MTEAVIFKDIGKKYRRNKESFWALKDVSLSVEQGEIFGIIGHNGSGKSTLLKICSKITLPTTGRIDIYGNTGTLLEVGTGFHPELTGLENIYFNGSVLGISKKEITASLDDIIKFSGVEKSIDVPVKRYSSGMYTRLAFAVAAHLNVENMFIDEVLAVGDAEFQRKCLSKMGDMAKSGRTILFVSHDTSAITRLCDRVMWLHNGSPQMIGESNKVVQEYITHMVPRGGILDIPQLLEKLPSDPTVKINDVLITQNGVVPDILFRDYPIEISITYTIFRKETGTRIFVSLLGDNGNVIIKTYHDENAGIAPVLERGVYKSTVTIPSHLLSHRDYEISIGALVFNQRACTGTTGEGIRVPISVETLSPSDCYQEESLMYRPLIKPKLKWQTSECNIIEEF